jgi:DNA polymerase III delta prime subunit
MNLNEVGIWNEQYRPKELSDVIGNAHLITKFGEFIESKNFPHLLFYGRAGCGKSTCAKILAKEATEDVLYINASDENSIDMIRNKVTRFCSTMSMGNQIKVVILDEYDGMCLEENEEILVFENNEIKSKKMKDLPKNAEFLVFSYDIENDVVELDTAKKLSPKKKEIFEIELEDGSILKASAEHRFFVEDEKSNIIEKRVHELSENDKIVNFSTEILRQCYK